MKKDNVIEMEKRGNAYVPVRDKNAPGRLDRSETITWVDSRKVESRKVAKQRPRKPLQVRQEELLPLPKILEGFVIDFFREIRRSMFR